MREQQNPKWRGEGEANAPSRKLFTDKMFFYREIARQVRDLGSVPAALAAVQTRLDTHKKLGRGGWGNRKTGLLAELNGEQPSGEVRSELTNLLMKMYTLC